MFLLPSQKTCQALFLLCTMSLAASAAVHAQHTQDIEHSSDTTSINFNPANPQAVFLAHSDLDFLPTDVTFNPAIPTPEAVLGYPVGTWHVRHDQLIAYMEAVAVASDRVTLETTGLTHEQRKLVLLSITTPENQRNIAQIKANHQATITAGKAPKESAPLVMYMGYSVHGNEPSGSNAALLIAYYLAAAQGPQVDELLENAVILLDPSLNPDGLARFAQWANMHKGKHPSANSLHREHKERFPSGRTNHYWFDLNRDWLLLTHPESRARVAQFQAWRPHILTDFHEMYTDQTYFFQPGVPSRKNPLTADQNIDLTNLLGEYHAQALDDEAQLYFTQERFDDFYYGKGSTYPDAHGAVGILFEQASSRGHLQDSINGQLSFAQTIKNQVTTSFSTFKGALAHKSTFLQHHAQFTRDTEALQQQDEVGGYLIALSKDAKRNQAIVANLNAHNITTTLLTRDIKANNIEFTAGDALFVTTAQPQYRLLSSLFSTRKSFPDNTFYDVSNWNIALAYNLAFTSLTKREARKVDATVIKQMPDKTDSSPSMNHAVTSKVAYVFTWDDSSAPALLYRLLANDLQARIAGKPFSAKTQSGEVEQFAAGTIIIPAGLQRSAQWQEKLRTMADHLTVQLVGLTSGLTPQGIDLGSPSMQVATLPNVMIVGGVGTSETEVGEIWHYFDTRLKMPVAVVDQDRISSANIADFTHIVFASGSYRSLSDSDIKALKSWVRDGGIAIGTKRGAAFLAQQGLLEASVLDSDAIDNEFSEADLHFADQDAHHAQKLVAGATYQALVDTTHPIMFGVVDQAKPNALLPMFKTNNMVLKAVDKPFISVAKYSMEPLLGGYSAEAMQELIAQSSAIVAHPYGRGQVIGFTDNVNFRGYWRGTEKLMANAVFMAKLITIR
jgi:hypothetical protein